MKKVQQRSMLKNKIAGRIMKKDFKEITPPLRRHKVKKRAPISLKEKIEIVHKVLVGKEL